MEKYRKFAEKDYLCSKFFISYAIKNIFTGHDDGIWSAVERADYGKGV